MSSLSAIRSPTKCLCVYVSECSGGDGCGVGGGCVVGGDGGR